MTTKNNAIRLKIIILIIPSLGFLIVIILAESQSYASDKKLNAVDLMIDTIFFHLRFIPNVIPIVFKAYIKPIILEQSTSCYYLHEYSSPQKCKQRVV
jgi:hypothetical protein